MFFGLNSSKKPPNCSFTLVYIFPLPVTTAVLFVATAQDQNEGMVVVGFSSTTLFPGCTAFPHFISSGSTSFPLSIATATHRHTKSPHTITPLLFGALVYSYVKFKLKLGDFSDFVFQLAWHKLSLAYTRA